MPTNLEKRYITHWRRKKVPDNLITDYKSFLKHREFLPFMPFNPKVMHALVMLAHTVFWTDKRINRFSLLLVMRDYWNQNKFPEGERPNYYNKSVNVAKTYRKPLLEKTHAILMQFALDVLCADKLPVSDGQIIDMMSLAFEFS